MKSTTNTFSFPVPDFTSVVAFSTAYLTPLASVTMILDSSTLVVPEVNASSNVNSNVSLFEATADDTKLGPVLSVLNVKT